MPFLSCVDENNDYLGNDQHGDQGPDADSTPAVVVSIATDGFIYIPQCAGTPTGVPTAFTGRVPLVWDTTNKKLYVYDAAWLGGTAPGVFS